MNDNFSGTIYGELNRVPHWYAVSTRARHEKKVFQQLLQKGVTSFLPLQTFHRRWSDRYKTIQEPLFSCYVFVKIALQDRLPVLQTDGVVRLVAFNNVPATIPESQIAAIRTILETKQTIEKTDYLIPGQRIQVIQGPLKGIRGILAQIKNQYRLVVRLDSIMQAIAVDIDCRDIKVIDENVPPQPARIYRL
ncbi:MAG: UpxY family transcription antiterminator [candidate division KSB1 bacterium]|nr:UpxY family transcription antiterminator [candidate division KSB1 bacterium]MDZ7317982.1 UpxY family transcription antiterminator [candidate division KSB1 bacterium]MDZ7340661.1 UpxY family transcription antiterminator [candidate division KSB1 bacterium]